MATRKNICPFKKYFLTTLPRSGYDQMNIFYHVVNTEVYYKCLDLVKLAKG